MSSTGFRALRFDSLDSQMQASTSETSKEYSCPGAVAIRQESLAATSRLTEKLRMSPDGLATRNSSSPRVDLLRAQTLKLNLKLTSIPLDKTAVMAQGLKEELWEEDSTREI